ncbi:MAG: SCO family protein [Bdellovibrionales bacterium]|nr:SCO family protein [Bdellovibrionales bacterium]
MKSLGVVILLLMSFSAQALSPNSVYHLQGKWTNQDGKTEEFANLKGRVRIVSMIFTQCTSACPMLVGDVKHFLAKLSAKEAEKVGVDLFSFDHERETPESLKNFTKKYKITSSQWNIYRGDKTAVAELAGLLGVQYKRLAGGAYVHSNNIILLNKEGEILKTIEGYDASADDFLALLKKTLAEP